MTSPEGTDITRLEGIADDMGFRVTIAGAGRPVLLLHGGGGPMTVAAFGAALATEFLVLQPVHPGFAGTDRPEVITGIAELARHYAGMIARMGLEDVILVGNSLGGWIAAEMALTGSPAISGIVLADPVGIAVEGQAVLDVFSIPAPEIAGYSFHAPERFRIDPATLTQDQRAMMGANLAALGFYAGEHNMQDPGLRDRLGQVDLPALVVWGESDRVVWPDYGRAYAHAFPNGQFALIEECGHLPQLEQPQKFRQLIRDFAATTRR